MIPDNREVQKFIHACSCGDIIGVKFYYNKFGKDILNFKNRSLKDRSPYYYSIRNGHIEVAKYLKEIDPSSPNSNLLKYEIYNIFLDVLSGSGTKPSLFVNGIKSNKNFHERENSKLIK